MSPTDHPGRRPEVVALPRWVCTGCVAADLAPRTAYDEVVTALGGAGETVTDLRQIGAAPDRAFAADVPYLVNVITDVDAPTRPRVECSAHRWLPQPAHSTRVRRAGSASTTTRVMRAPSGSRAEGVHIATFEMLEGFIQIP